MAVRGETVFRRKAPVLMERVLEAFPQWQVEDAAACAGNGGGESAGFTAMQEIDPTGGGTGGLGWFQWTGLTKKNPRRANFIAYMREHDLTIKDDEAHIGFLIHELQTSERKAIAATARAVGLDAKVIAFEKAYERAGIKHYPTRIAYAKVALDAYEALHGEGGEMEDDIHSGAYSQELEAIQEQLIELGYFEVGEADGRWGGKTAAAVNGYRNDRELPPGRIDAAFRAQLNKDAQSDWHRPISKKRAETTEEEAAKKSEPVKLTLRQRLAARWALILSGLGTAGAWIKDTFQSVQEYVHDPLSYLMMVPGWLWGLAALGIAGYFYINANNTVKAGVQDIREGKAP